MTTRARSWRYYQNKGYTARANMSMSGRYAIITYTHVEPGENPQTELVSTFQIAEHPTVGDWARINQQCAELAAKHMAARPQEDASA